MSDSERVAEVVNTINDCWLSGRYDDLSGYFHRDMVLAMPGFDRRLEGAAPIIESYREFGKTASVRTFTAAPPAVDVIADTAVATTNFEMEYDLEGTSYSDRGTDVLFFRNENGEWRVVWRTVIVGGSESGQ